MQLVPVPATLAPRSESASCAFDPDIGPSCCGGWAATGDYLPYFLAITSIARDRLKRREIIRTVRIKQLLRSAIECPFFESERAFARHNCPFIFLDLGLPRNPSLGDARGVQAMRLDALRTNVQQTGALLD